MTLLTTAVLIGACTGGGSTPTAPSGVAPSDVPPNGAAPQGFDGRTFLSIAIAGRVLVAGTVVRLTFHGDQIGAQAGCNSLGGIYHIDGDRLVVGQMGGTDMGCDGPRMDQDTWLASFLDGATIDLDGDSLTLTNGGIILTLQDREIADPDRPLLGTRWLLDGIVSGDAVSSLPAGVSAALVFTEGRVEVEAGCNRGGGAVEVTATTLDLGPIALTKMACDGPAMAVEQAVTAVLSGRVAYTIEAALLTIDAGGAGLMFRAER